MSDQWYYADRRYQQQGPVDDAALVAAFGAGELTATSLVWREGLPAWVPLSQVSEELGLALPAAPPPIPPRPVAASTRSGARPWVVAVIVVAVGLVFVLGIFLAIAIPAYSDYNVRAKVSMALAEGSALKAAVNQHFTRAGRCPVNGEAGIDPPERYASRVVSEIRVGKLEDGACAIQIHLTDLDGQDMEGAEIVLAMDADGAWTSSSTLPIRYLPASMRRPLER